jgi:hypothetical protein
MLDIRVKTDISGPNFCRLELRTVEIHAFLQCVQTVVHHQSGWINFTRNLLQSSGSYLILFCAKRYRTAMRANCNAIFNLIYWMRWNHRVAAEFYSAVYCPGALKKNDFFIKLCSILCLYRRIAKHWSQRRKELWCVDVLSTTQYIGYVVTTLRFSYIVRDLYNLISL